MIFKILVPPININKHGTRPPCFPIVVAGRRATCKAVEAREHSPSKPNIRNFRSNSIKLTIDDDRIFGLLRGYKTGRPNDQSSFDLRIPSSRVNQTPGTAPSGKRKTKISPGTAPSGKREINSHRVTVPLGKRSNTPIQT